jgi:hypothetical protein
LVTAIVVSMPAWNYRIKQQYHHLHLLYLYCCRHNMFRWLPINGQDENERAAEINVQFNKKYPRRNKL